jgi:hypothetical protein
VAPAVVAVAVIVVVHQVHIAVWSLCKCYTLQLGAAAKPKAEPSCGSVRVSAIAHTTKTCCNGMKPDLCMVILEPGWSMTREMKQHRAMSRQQHQHTVHQVGAEGQASTTSPSTTSDLVAWQLLRTVPYFQGLSAHDPVLLVPLLMVAADQLQLPDLHEACLQLAQRQLSPRTALPWLLAAHMGQLEALEKAAFEYARANMAGGSASSAVGHQPYLAEWPLSPASFMALPDAIQLSPS